MRGAVYGWLNEVKSIIGSISIAVSTGWWSKVTDALVSPINSLTYQALYALGWIGILFVIYLVVRGWLEDYESYFAMGVYAVPALITFFLPWDKATLLMGLSLLGLAIIGGNAARNWLKAWKA